MNSFFIVLLVVAVVLFFYQAGKTQARREVEALGGLRNIFFELDAMLASEGLIFKRDTISSIEYQSFVDPQRELQLVLRKNMNLQEPYEMQMFLILNGKTDAQTIRYLINPEQSVEKYKEVLEMMSKELLEKYGKQFI